MAGVVQKTVSDKAVGASFRKAGKVGDMLKYIIIVLYYVRYEFTILSFVRGMSPQHNLLSSTTEFL
ncbi:hypothetical protein LEP1GSC070_2152 [Leptospira santarosai str. AIM]|nr:hypothetical protein LEP1GSC070_2152 [Leptospira santarosai str. AIM]